MKQNLIHSNTLGEDDIPSLMIEGSVDTLSESEIIAIGCALMELTSDSLDIENSPSPYGEPNSLRGLRKKGNQPIRDN